MDKKLYPVAPAVAERAHINAERYQQMYARSLQDPDGFWREQAQALDWIRDFTKVKNTRFSADNTTIQWFEDGRINVSANCLDRHLATRADQAAIIWEPDDPTKPGRTLTYKELHLEVCRFANALLKLGVTKGNVVTICLPMIPEAAIAVLACARIGAVHSVIFAGFSPQAIAGRVDNAKSKVVLTCDEGMRGGRAIPLKANVDAATEHTQAIEKVVVLRYSGGDIGWHEDRDVWWHELLEGVADDCPAPGMRAEDPLFILYTSGSTGAPKGLLHSSAGYLLWTQMTFKYTFDYHEGDIYWCSADIGWVTGHSYIVYGPLVNGATSIMFEGVPNFPNSRRWGEVIAKHKVNIFYTAPTALRALMREGDDIYSGIDLSSLRILGSVGEPINPEAWEWYRRVFGADKLPIVDTWWQTETGGHMITPLPGATALKPGSATLPFFGVKPVLLDDQGRELEGEASGVLAIADSWPGQSRSIYGNHQRFQETYYQMFSGYYFTGDGAYRDADGYYWITGRVDDVINVSGHRMGTAEIESSLVGHDAVSEAAVIGFPHDIKGEGIYCYVTLRLGVDESEDLRAQLKQWVRKEIGPIATPDVVLFAPALPKTRSGKIMRRILRKIAANAFDELGDTTTLADPSVVDDLIARHKQQSK